MFSSNWVYLSYASSIRQPCNLIGIGSNLYITSDYGIYKTDFNINIISQYLNYVNYRGVAYNSTSKYIYSAVFANNQGRRVDVFDLDLNLKISIPVSLSIYSIVMYNNSFYIGSTSGVILVMVDNNIIDSFNACNDFISSIFFDEYGNFAATGTWYSVYVFNSLRVLNKTLTVPMWPRDIHFDNDGRLVLITQIQVSFYY